MASFKKLSSKLGNVDKLIKQLESDKSSWGNQKDPTEELFWQPKLGKDGNAYAVIRWLPEPACDLEKDEENALPWIKTWSYFFQGPETKQWYVNNSLLTLKKKDPCGALSRYTYKAEDPFLAAINKTIGRRMDIITNIYVIEDENNPGAEGKNFLFKCPKRVFDKIEDKMHPKFKDQAPFSPFSLTEGADFVMRISTDHNVPIGNKKVDVKNFDASSFNSPSPLSTDESELERIWNQEHSLLQFLDPSRFKTWDELRERLEKVFNIDLEFNDELDIVGLSRKGGTSHHAAPARREEPKDDEPAPRETRASVKEEQEKPWDDESGDDSSDDDELFKKLAEL